MNGFNKFPVTDNIIGYSTSYFCGDVSKARIDYNGEWWLAETDSSEFDARHIVIHKFMEDNPSLADKVKSKQEEVKAKLVDVGGAAALQLASDERYDTPLGSFKNEQLVESIKMKYYNDKI
nr:hypothetical protein [Moraxella sp.]